MPTDNTNMTLLTDGYKLTHHMQYPIGTQYVYSYFESRVGSEYQNTTFFGLQAIVKRWLTGQRVTLPMIDEGEYFCHRYFGRGKIFNRAMWERIVHKHGGRLPVRIRAVPEGVSIPTSNVLMTVENTDPECFALTNHLETLLTHVWYPSTVATLSRNIKQTIKGFLEQTVGNAAALPFMLHDFGYRGVECIEAAGIGGAAHLVNFLGTDTIAGMEYAKRYYGGYEAEADVGYAFSVPATEHSVMTSLGPDGEADVVIGVLKAYPEGIVSIVGDSYDIFRFTRDIICRPDVKKMILERTGNTVLRPDSGDQVSTILKMLEILEEGFGAKRNDKGYKLIDGPVRILWGDGINRETIYKILRALESAGWAADNMACFGMGGALLQDMTRDVQRFAFKCSAQKRDGKWFDIYKSPLDTSKASKKGRLMLVRSPYGNIKTVAEGDFGDAENLLELVFEDGELKRDMTFKQVRENAAL